MATKPKFEAAVACKLSPVAVKYVAHRPRFEDPKGPDHLGGSGCMPHRNFLNMKPLEMYFLLSRA